MADVDTNVTALRPKAKDATAALCAKRYRRKHKLTTGAGSVSSKRRNGKTQGYQSRHHACRPW